MDISKLAVDVALMTGGVWWDYLTRMPCDDRAKPHASNLCFLVVPLGDEYRRAYEEACQPYREELRRGKGKLPLGMHDKARGMALGQATLKGWANLYENGAALPYSEERAVEFMSDPKWCLVRDFVERAAQNEAAVMAAEESEAKGN